jgi:protocatechuate 3,4-dioxygenase beta subunit
MRKKTAVALGIGALLIVGWMGWLAGPGSKAQPGDGSGLRTPDSWGRANPTETGPGESPSPAPAAPEEKPNENQSGSISGTVRLKATGAPVTNVNVQAWSEGKPLGEMLACTDEKGSYTLIGIPSGIGFLLQATGPSAEYYVDSRDYYILSVKPGEKKAGANIKLSERQAGTISGTVVGRRVFYQNPENPTSATKLSDYERQEDTALPNIKITLDSVRNVKGSMIQEAKIETITDQAGHFVFEAVRPGQYYVWAELPEGAAFVADQDQSRCYYANLLEKTVHENIQFYFRMDGVSIEGRVTGTQGKPIAGGEVTAFLAERSSPRRGSQYLQNHRMCSVLTNDQGQYRFDNLATFNLMWGLTYLRRGEYDFEFRIECQAAGYSRGQVSLPPYPPRLIETGIMFDENLSKSLTEERLKDFHSVDVKLPAGQGNLITGVDLVLPSSTRISGRVVDSRGRNYLSAEDEKSSMTKIFLFPSEILEGKSKPGERTFWCTLGKGSRFCFEDVPPGNYLFNIETRSRVYAMSTRARNKALVVREGETIENLEVVAESMADRGTLVGHVVDAQTGQPVEALTVEVPKVEGSGEPTPQTGYIQTHGVEGSRYRLNKDIQEGDFTVIGLSAGKATVKISALGYAPLQTEIEIPAGETVEQTFQLGGNGGGLMGRVVEKATNQPIEFFAVKVTPTEGEGKGKPLEGKVKLDRNQKGTFRLSGLPAGRVAVEVSALGKKSVGNGSGAEWKNAFEIEPGYSDSTTHSAQTAEVEITAGKIAEHTFALESRGSLTGHLTVNGEMVRRQVSVHKPGEPGKEQNLFHANDEGIYKSKGLDVGAYVASASVVYECGFQKKSDMFVMDQAPIEIQPGEETRQDFEFRENASISGTFRASDRNLYWQIAILKGRQTSFDRSRLGDNENFRAMATGMEKGDRYEIRFLEPGTYTLFATLGTDYASKAPTAEKRQVVTLTEGQAATVDFEFP